MLYVSNQLKKKMLEKIIEEGSEFQFKEMSVEEARRRAKGNCIRAYGQSSNIKLEPGDSIIILDGDREETEKEVVAFEIITKPIIRLKDDITISEISIGKLATILDEWVYSNDTYDYNDNVQDREEHIKQIERDLSSCLEIKKIINKIEEFIDEELEMSEVVKTYDLLYHLEQLAFLLKKSNLYAKNWTITDEFQVVKRLSETEFVVLEGVRLPNEKIDFYKVEVDMEDYLEDEEYLVDTYCTGYGYNSIQAIKELYKQDYLQVIAEFIAETDAMTKECDTPIATSLIEDEAEKFIKDVVAGKKGI